VVVVRQEQSRQGFIELVDSNSGETKLKSSLNFTFGWPYVQMSSDSNSGVSYLTAFPDGNSYPVLHKLNKNLDVVYSWLHGTFTWWDLQYAPVQDTLYGILVTQDLNGGMYGRTLSNYTFNEKTDDISAVKLYELPYMWYVNASSFDVVKGTYFALINNFPGKVNSTLDQQIITADFSKDVKVSSPAVALVPITSGDIMMQFVAYSNRRETLYFAGPAKATPNMVYVGIICPAHGTVKAVLYEAKDVVSVGPLTVDDDNNQLLLYVKVASSTVNQWKLLSIPYHGTSVTIIKEYEGDSYRSYAAATHTTY